MALEPVGFKAVIEGFSEYISQAKQMADQSTKIAQANAAAAAQSQVLSTSEGTLAQAHKAAATAAADTENAHTKLASAIKGAVLAAGSLITVYGSYRTISDAVRQTDQLGESTLNLMRATGLAAPAASGLIYAFEKLGLSSDTVSKQFSFFERNMTQVQEAQEGFTGVQKTTGEVLEALGITVLDTSGKLLPFDTLLGKVADRFASMPDGVVKTGLAVQLFGRSGADLLPLLNEGSAGIAALNAEAQKLGLTLTNENVVAIHNYTLAQRDFEASLKGLQVEVGTELMPELTKLANYFTDHQQDVRNFVQAAIGDFSHFATDVESGANTINDALKWIPDNQAVIIGAVTAIGLAMAASFGPLSLAAVGITAIIAGIGELNNSMSGQEQLGQKAAADPGKRDVTIAQLQAGGQSKEAATKQYEDSLSAYSAYQDKGYQSAGDKAIADEKKAQDQAAADAAKAAADGLNKIPPAATKASNYLADTLAGAALGSVKSAEGALFGQPTKEQAGLTLLAANAQMAADSLKDRLTPEIDALTRRGADLTGTLGDLNASYTQQIAAVDKEIAQAQARATLPFTATGVTDAASQRVITEARNNEIKALQDEKTTLQDTQKLQVAGIQSQIDANKKQIDAADAQIAAAQKLVTSYQDQEKLLKDQEDIEKAQIDLANKTLLSTADQQAASEDLVKKMGDASDAYLAAAKITSDNLIPEFDKMNQALIDMRTYGVSTTKDELIQLQSEAATAANSMSAAAVASQTFAQWTIQAASGAFDAAVALNAVGRAAATASQNIDTGLLAMPPAPVFQGGSTGSQGPAPVNPIQKAPGAPYTLVPPQPSTAPKPFVANTPQPAYNQMGGFTRSPTLSWLSEDSQRELVLPLENAARSRQLLATMPASLLAAIMPKNGPSIGSVFGSMSVQGYTLEDMEATVHRTVSQAFTTARQASSRSGALLPQSIGPGGY